MRADYFSCMVPFGRGGLGVFAFYDVPSRRFAPGFSHFFAFKVHISFYLTSSVTGSAALKHGFLSYRLLRMNVQGCHNILAICSHIEFEKMTASGPVHHPLKTYTFFFIPLIIIVSFIIISSPRSVTNSGSAWGYPPPPRLAKNKNLHPPLVFDSEISGRRPAGPRLRGPTASAYINTIACHVF